ncbi:hypothetical protein [uncultured Draconibacterium sp.]|uniref:hypothetical protein n=1 Tax=uncultured Draconibacterium sp. TaxID=1573823 RepID=UPI00321791BB
MNNNELAIYLIGEQIRNQVLMISLENLGFDCTTYTLIISEVILTLVEFEQKTDKLYQRYFELIEKAANETSYLNMDEMLVKWSRNVFNELQDIKLKGLSP